MTTTTPNGATTMMSTTTTTTDPTALTIDGAAATWASIHADDIGMLELELSGELD